MDRVRVEDEDSRLTIFHGVLDYSHLGLLERGVFSDTRCGFARRKLRREKVGIDETAYRIGSDAVNPVDSALLFPVVMVAMLRL